MTMYELMNKIQELREEKVALAMKDGWSDEDFKKDDELFRRIQTLTDAYHGKTY